MDYFLLFEKVFTFQWNTKWQKKHSFQANMPNKKITWEFFFRNDRIGGIYSLTKKTHQNWDLWVYFRFVCTNTHKANSFSSNVGHRISWKWNLQLFMMSTTIIMVFCCCCNLQNEFWHSHCCIFLIFDINMYGDNAQYSIQCLFGFCNSIDAIRYCNFQHQWTSSEFCRKIEKMKEKKSDFNCNSTLIYIAICRLV